MTKGRTPRLRSIAEERSPRLALPALLALSACSSLVRVPGLPPVDPDVLDRTFTREEVAVDVDRLLAVLEEVHPDPYRSLPREEAAERRRALCAGLAEAETRRSLQPKLATLVAALGDGHTSVHLPWDDFLREERDGGCFPIDIAWDGEGLIVRRTAVMAEDGSLGPGAALIAVAGRPASELFRTFLARQSGESEAWRAANVEGSFPVHLWLEGLRPPYPVRIASALDPGQVFDLEIPGMPFSALARGSAPRGGPAWRLERREDGTAVS